MVLYMDVDDLDGTREGLHMSTSQRRRHDCTSTSVEQPLLIPYLCTMISQTRFLNDTAMVLGRDRTGLCAKCQRKVSRTIKASRQMGFLPTISDFEIRDTGPGGLYAWAAKGEGRREIRSRRDRPYGRGYVRIWLQQGTLLFVSPRRVKL